MSMTPSKPAISRPLAMVRLRFFAALLLLALSSVGVIVVLNPKISSTDSSAHLPEVLSKPPASGGVAAKCTFCKGEESNFNQDWVVPEAGGNTCGTMKTMAARQLNGSDICALIQGKERVCCPGLPAATNNTKHQLPVTRKRNGDENLTTSHPPILYGHVHDGKDRWNVA